MELDQEPADERVPCEASGDEPCQECEENDPEAKPPKPLDLAATTEALKMWLRASREKRPILQATWLRLEQDGLSPNQGEYLERIFCLLHQTSSDSCRMDAITVSQLGTNLQKLGLPGIKVR